MLSKILNLLRILMNRNVVLVILVFTSATYYYNTSFGYRTTPVTTPLHSTLQQVFANATRNLIRLNSDIILKEPVYVTPENSTYKSQKYLPHHSKWIVVTSIFPPTEQIQKLSKISDWKVLVVGDKKTPDSWSHPGVIFLGVETQLKLGYRVHDYLPYNSYTRKVVGYLYAIEHGAEFIYDTDDDNGPEDPEHFNRTFVLDNLSRGLVWRNTKNKSVINPYVHFGQPSVWPRGFPLEDIGDSFENSYTACPLITPLIQQGVVDGDPDVDAIFRLTRKPHFSPLNIRFDPHAPPLILPPNVLTPFNSQNTLFSYKAFWGLLLPISTTFRVTDIWRGYWAQPLLWGVGGTLGFSPPQTRQRRNAHSYLKDFGEEEQLYKRSGALVKFLERWTCEYPTLYPCMLHLSTQLVHEKIWSEVEVKLVDAWISDLKAIGYREPPLTKEGYKAPPLTNRRYKEPIVTNTGYEEPQMTNKGYEEPPLTNRRYEETPLTYKEYVEPALKIGVFPCVEDSPQSAVMFSGVEPQTDNLHKLRAPLRELCNFPLSSNNTSRDTVFFSDTLLIIEYNNPHYENIWLLDSIYRPHYPNILYCGTLLSNDTILTDLISTPEFLYAGVGKFSFISVNVTGGRFSYECAVRALDMGYRVDGYLLLSDDVLWNFWNTVDYDRRKPWFSTDIISRYDLVDKVNLDNWIGWKSKFGFAFDMYCTKAIAGALEQIYSAKNPHVVEFKIARDSFGYNNVTAMHSYADFFYFPASKAQIVYEVGRILRNNLVHLEIAIPFMITGLSAPDSIVLTPGRYIWGRERKRPFDFFNANNITYIHALKPRDILGKGILREKYCRNYVSRVLNS